MPAAAKKAEAKPAAQKPKASSLVVTAPLVAVKVKDGSVIHLFDGDVVPDGVEQESIDHLLSLEYVAKSE